MVDRLLAWRSRERLHALGIGAWFVAAFIAIVWSQGLRPVAFSSPDEALNRFAAEVIATTGKPYLNLPFPDPEDLAHARSWLSVGSKAIPVYAPVAIYVYALLTYLGTLGFLLSAALPASGVAALAAGTSRLLPPERRWLGLLAPGLAMPTFYWMLRTWMNVSAMLLCLCWGLFFWSRYREAKRRAWLVATFASVGLAAAIRPDCTVYLLMIVLFFAVSAEPKGWKVAVALTLGAGTLAVALNLPLNYLITGKATRAAYQLAFEHYDGPTDHQPLLVRLLEALLFPLGVPSLDAALGLLWKYALLLEPMLFVSLGQLALWPLLKHKERRERWLFGLALLGIVVYIASRMDPTTAGAVLKVSEVHHSVPRYWTPVYLLGPIAPLWWLAQQKGRRFLALATIATGVALFGALKVGFLSQQSLTELRRFAEQAGRRADATAEHVPKNAMVYGRVADRSLWSRFRVGFLDEPEPTASSIARAVAHGIPTFVWVRPVDKIVPLRKALGKHELRLAKLAELDPELTLYRVAPARSRSAR